MRFHARDFPLGRRFTGHFEADGLSSQEVSFTVGPDAIFVEASLGSPALIRLTHTIEEELVEGTLFMTIGAERSILRTYRPVPRFDELSLPPIPCGATAGFHVEARGLSGKEYHSTTHNSYPVPAFASVFIPGCLSVDDVGIQGQSSPEAEIPSTAVAVLFHDLAENPESVALLLGSEVARVAPDSTQSKATFDVSGLAEGSYRLSTRAELPGGAIEEGDYDLSFFLDQTPPSTAILLPVEGGNACVVRESDAEWVELEIAGEDELLIGADVELQTTSGAWERVRTMAIGAPLGFPTSKFQKRLLAEIPTGHEGNLSLRLVVSARRILSEAGGRPSPIPGSPPPWPFPDNNGSILGEAVRNVVIVREQALEGVAIDPALFSPNGDGILDVTHVRGELLEAASLTVRVLRGSVPVRTLVDGVAFGVGPIDAVWDGRDDLGAVVPDGQYRVEVVAVSGCGASSRGEALVEVDTTPPEVAISSPTLLQPVSITVEVRGMAKDQKFLSYQLEFGEGASPPAFNPIGAPVEHQVGKEKLGDWNVGELAEGLYTLRLTAEDRAGNERSTSVVVEVRSPDLVTRFTGEPLTFSPNGDGVKDRTELSFLLKSDALVTLEIRRPNETVVTTLLSGESLPSGTHSVSWDGSAPDGDYIAHLSAADPILPGVTEEARLALVVDTSPPALEVSAPLPDAFVFLPGNVFGSIEDPNLERYTLDLGPEEGALARLAEDSLSVSGVLAPLLGLGDGGYRLEVRATDLAGNAADAALRFDIDSTPPAVSLREPTDRAQISTAAGSVRVAGRVLETNLQSYALEIGLGAAPSVFAPLTAGFSLPEADVESTWDVSQFPDGTYTFRLRATDKAGSESETSRQVVLDGTRPKVEIAEPSEGDFATKEDRVLGSVTDENFSEAVLSIARGESPLQEIARFDAPVLEGILKDGLPLEDGAYTLFLAAKDLAGNESTVPRSFTLDSAPPAAPQGLQTTVRDRDDVRLSWTPNGESDLAGYRVFRDGVLLTAEPIRLPEHFDPDRPEGHFRYTVVAVDRAGLESEPSAPAEARIDLTPPDVVLRSPEEGARVRGLVDVVGTAFSENDFHEYRLSVAPEATPASPTLLKRSPLPVSFGTLSQWEAVTLEGGFIFTLEGEDTSGNVAVDTLRVVVDNVAPAPPVLTSVQVAASPDDVEVVWQVSPDADVSGYLVFRNGKIANAPGVVSGDLRPFLVPPPSYLDTGLPDGRFCYRLVAMDEAGNLSGDSNEICIFLDNRAPRAAIVEPENGARFDSPRTLRAVSEDEDVASVLFQFQESTSTFWADIALDTEAPYEVLWNISGLAFGDYRLRAVATDSGSKVDPFPAFIDVVLGDSTPPATPGNLVARVDGSAVTLTWDAVTVSDLAGYRVYREDTLLR
ncbi:MAG TPA: Ig-like domain-containing protein, partial [Vicinamibacteria bacterium]|nr:Ig-like domain-containing protein [Vicinamibacteria bacterium]